MLRKLKKKLMVSVYNVVSYLKVRHLPGLCNVKWTITHAHFVQMGGFMLMDGNASRGVLTAEKFLELLEEKKIDLPTITKEGILECSKSDELSKFIALAQTEYYIMQFCLRIQQDLGTTGIEWLTVALALLNIGFHFVWWHKPLHVETPIPVRLQQKACMLVQQAESITGRS